MLDENPYIKWLVGFIVIPFIFAIIMFIILDEPEQSIGTRWGSTVIIITKLNCIYGI